MLKEKVNLEKDWNSLTEDRKSIYFSKAKYLIDNGYITGYDILELAEKIYIKEN